MDRKIYIQTAKLVKQWGESPLSSGITLHKTLMWEGVSLWDAIAPIFTLTRLPLYISSEGEYHYPSWKQSLRLFIRYWVKRFGSPKLHLFPHTNNEKFEQNSAALFLNFQPIFLRETFEASAEILFKHHQIQTVALSEAPQKGLHPFISFRSILDYGNSQLNSRLRQHLKNWNSTQKKLLQELPSIINQTGPLWPFLKNEFKWFIHCEIPKLLKYLILAEHILKEIQPRIIISPDDTDPRTRLYTSLARNLKIPSLIMQQGPFDEYASEWSFFSGDKVASYGKEFSDILVGFGIPLSQIHVTGCPRFDILLQNSEDTRQKIRRSLHIKSDPKVVLFASQPNVPGAFHHSEIRREMIRSIGKIVPQFEHLHLVVKPHPGEKEREVRQLIGKNLRVSFVNGQSDIRDFIRASDIIITFFSTSGLLGLINGKPLICVQFGKATGKNFYEKYGLAPIARSPEDLKKLLILSSAKGTLSNETKNVLENLVWHSDGKAASRVADLVVKTSKKFENNAVL